MADGEPVNVALIMTSTRFDQRDESWRVHEEQLIRDLRERVGAVRRELVASPGAKGAVESVIIALGSAGAVTAAVDCFKAWLNRDRSRSLKIRWSADGRQNETVLEATGVSRRVFEELIRAVGGNEEG